MAKYDALNTYLADQEDDSVALSFDQVANLVGGLPQSAFDYEAWWSNDQSSTHVQANAWLSAGFRVEELRLGRSVVFSRVEALEQS